MYLARIYSESFTYGRRLSHSLRSELDTLIKDNPLVIFMKGTPDVPMVSSASPVNTHLN